MALDPVLTVVTATRDRPAALREKARSVAAAARAFGAVEWIVAVDGADGTVPGDVAARAAPAPVTVLRLPTRRGPGGARNAAAARARGESLLFSDDDCLLAEDAFEAHVAAQATACVALGPIRFVDPDTRRTLEVVRPRRPRWWHVNGANTSVDRRAFERLGGFDERLTGYGAEDVELGRRLHGAGLRLRPVAASEVTHLGPAAPARGDEAAAASAGRNAARAAEHAPPLRWRLGVHPALLWAKRLALYGPWSRLADPARLAYERAYARGAAAALCEAARPLSGEEAR